MEEFEKQFTCLEKNTEKHKAFTIPRENETEKIDKDSKDITKNIS